MKTATTPSTPAQQRRHPRDNNSRAPRQHKTNQQGSSGATEKKFNECVRTTTMCNFRTQPTGDPQGNAVAVARPGSFMQLFAIEPAFQCEMSAGTNQTWPSL